MRFKDRTIRSVTQLLNRLKTDTKHIQSLAV